MLHYGSVYFVFKFTAEFKYDKFFHNILYAKQ